MSMKSILVILCLLTFPALQAYSHYETGGITYSLSGVLKNMDDEKIYLTKRSYMFSPRQQKAVYIDSCIVRNGRFSMQGRIPECNYYSLTRKNASDWLVIWLDETPATVEGDATKISEAFVKGSRETEDGKVLRSITQSGPPLEVKWDAGKKQMNMSIAGNTKMSKEDQERTLRENAERINTGIRRFIEEHPDSHLALICLRDNVQQYGIAGSRKMFSQLSGRVRSHSMAVTLDKKLGNMGRHTKLNESVMTLVQPDQDGSMVSLNTYRGKYVLVDFWASWCVPCRAENPFLRKAYEAYKAKGFDIVQVSLDTDKAKWLSAITEDGLPWKHISDLKGFPGPDAVKYDIESIPANFLLNKKGVIIAKNLRGDELEKKLSQLLN